MAGARQLAASRPGRLVTALGTAQTVVRGATSVIVVLLAIEVLRTGDAGVGLLWGAIGVGGLVGIPLALVVVDRHGVYRSLVPGLVAWGLPLSVCAIVPVPGVALVMFGIVGFGNGIVDIGYYAALQRAFAERVLTRVLGVVEAMFQAGVAAGAFAGALLLDHLGPRTALFAVGLVLPGLAILSTPRLTSLDRDLGRRDDEIDSLARALRLRRLVDVRPRPDLRSDRAAGALGEVCVSRATHNRKPWLTQIRHGRPGRPDNPTGGPGRELSLTAVVIVECGTVDGMFEAQFHVTNPTPYRFVDDGFSQASTPGDELLLRASRSPADTAQWSVNGYFDVDGDGSQGSDDVPYSAVVARRRADQL